MFANAKYYPDGSPYSHARPFDDSINVGWLGTFMELPVPYRRRRPKQELIKGLHYMLQRRVHLIRSQRYCHLCSVRRKMVYYPYDRSKQFVDGMVYDSSPDGLMALGTAECRFHHPDGTVFAVPDLLVHYVECHHYDPPAKFKEAVAHELRLQSYDYDSGVDE